MIRHSDQRNTWTCCCFLVASVLAVWCSPVAHSDESGVCARVRIKISQNVVLTRTVFKATLEVSNSAENVPLEQFKVTLDIRDANGYMANDRFVIAPPVLKNVGDVDGGGVILPGTTAIAEWTITPTHDAAPELPTQYAVGGVMEYMQGTNGMAVTLYPASITVKPDPDLVLDYFVVRDVYGDDPFTPELEPPVPFPMGLLVRNDGGGKAFDFRITSSEPQIVDNDKGLLVDFKMVKTQVNSDLIPPSLHVNLGDIEPGQAALACWFMTCSVQGRFIEYKASFEHVDGMGDPRLSLIDSANIHELTHAVRVDNPADDGRPDFLANDIPDEGVNPDHLPNQLYNSDGTRSPVAVASNVSTNGPVATDHPEVHLTCTAPAGFVYIRADNPGRTGFRLQKVLRPNGTEVLMGDNVWVTRRTIREQGQPARVEDLIHIFDRDSAGSYTLVYETTAPVTSVDAARLSGDGAEVVLDADNAPVVTGVFDDFFYAEKDDRTSGIRVLWSGVDIGRNDRVSIAGTLGTSADYERFIRATSVDWLGTGLIRPLGMRSGSIGGQNYFYDAVTGAGQRGQKAWQWVKVGDESLVHMLVGVPGLSNIGLLVKIWGTVVAVEGDSFFVDDGSGYDYGDPSQPGVKVRVPSGLIMPSVGAKIAVTGISSCYRSGNEVYRILLARDQADIVIME